MVNRGRSGACVTCKERRVKCDEARPNCGPCLRLSLPCGGYQTKYANLKFKDQSHKFGSVTTRLIRKENRPPSLRPLAEPDTSVSFFLQHYASMGRDMGSARGFFEVLIPVYGSQQLNSALSLAVSAVASAVMALWRHTNFRASREAYTQALQCLQKTIQHPSERGKPATMLAVLSLQLYESITATYGLRSANRIHHDGAVSLLPFAESELGSVDYNGMISAYLRKFILHIEICSAIRQERPLHNIASLWVGDRRLLATPDNQSAALDAIGTSVAKLQALHASLVEQSGSVLSLNRALAGVVIEAKHIDQRLIQWAQAVPNHWHPLQLTSDSEGCVDPSIPTYQRVCEIYPSCQIATIWNLWRVQRLITLKISIRSILVIENSSQYATEELSANQRHLASYTSVLQDLVDHICYSVPFFLGNRTKPQSLVDFTNPDILFPSCHSHSLVGQRSRVYPDQDPKIGAPDGDHRRSLIARGHWNALGPLSRLLTLFMDDYGQLMVALLRPEQHQWIREQFLRLITVLDFPQENDESERESFSGMPYHSNPVKKVDDLANKVRNGVSFMSGP